MILKGWFLVLASLASLGCGVAGTELLFPGDKELRHVTSPLPFTYISEQDLPRAFSWDNVNGKSYLTRNLNQHIPQYCGSCFAHSSMSALADRIKIARNATGVDINLSIQFILNCASEAGSCHGGSAIRVYHVLHKMGAIPYVDCQPYIACSHDSTNGFCPYVDTTCSNPDQICKTCTNQTCSAIKHYPNATIAEYGSYNDADVWKIQAEIYARGPVKASVNAEPLQNYTGGIMFDSPITRNTTHNHGVSLIGWGVDDESQKQYWIVRNSWGQYWGEFGHFRVELGKNLLGIEGHIAWATPGSFSTHNFPCNVDGSNCDDDDAADTLESVTVE